MRAFSLVVILAVLGSGLSCLRASEGFEELANRAKAGATEEALGAFVQKSSVAYDLTVDEIFVLSDLGYSPKTIAAIVEHGKQVKAGKVPTTTEASLPPATTDTAATTQPAVTALQVDSTTTTQSTTTITAAQNNPVTNSTAPQTEQTQIQSADQAAATSTVDANGNQIDALAIANADPNATTLTTTSGETLHVEETVNASFNPGSGEAVAPPEGDENVSMFYESLSPYGEWVKLDGAWYWRPQACVTDPNWRPYCDRGHWTWTDSDWCWQSDYSWGWAPFHYGRWAECEGYGWLWMPDTCWSPAWVSWRECDSAYGWAPLPWGARYDAGLGFRFGGKHWGVDFGFGLGYRDYCFCPREHFCDLSLRINVYGRHENNRFFGQSRLLQNNVSYVNNRVIVNGPHFDHVQASYHEPIRQLHIADANIKAGEKLSHANREDRRNGTIALYRPQVKETSRITPASYVSKRINMTNSVNATNRAVSGVKYPTSGVRTGEQRIGNNVQFNHNGTQFNNTSTLNHTGTQFNNGTSINHNSVINNQIGHSTTGEHLLNTSPSQSNGTQKNYESTTRNFAQPINQNNVMTNKQTSETPSYHTPSIYQPAYQNQSSSTPSQSSSGGSFRGTTSNGGSSGNYSGGSYSNGGNYNNNNNNSSNGHRGR